MFHNIIRFLDDYMVKNGHIDPQNFKKMSNI